MTFNTPWAVLMSIDEWHRMKRMARRDLKELLLAPEARQKGELGATGSRTVLEASVDSL